MLFELSETLLCRATPSMRLSTTLFGSRTTAKAVLIVEMIRQSENHDSQTVPVSGILLQPLKQRTIASEDRTNERVQRGEGERERMARPFRSLARSRADFWVRRLPLQKHFALNISSWGD